MASFKQIINGLHLKTENVTKVLRYEYNVKVMSDDEIRILIKQTETLLDDLNKSLNQLSKAQVGEKLQLLRNNFDNIATYGSHLISRKSLEELSEDDFQNQFKLVEHELELYRRLTTNDALHAEHKQAISDNIMNIEQRLNDAQKAA